MLEVRLEPVLEKVKERSQYVVQPGHRVLHSVQGGGWGLHRFLPSQMEVPSDREPDRQTLAERLLEGTPGGGSMASFPQP